MMGVVFLRAGLTHGLTDASTVLYAIRRLPRRTIAHATGRTIVTS